MKVLKLLSLVLLTILTFTSCSATGYRTIEKWIEIDFSSLTTFEINNDLKFDCKVVGYSLNRLKSSIQEDTEVYKIDSLIEWGDDVYNYECFVVGEGKNQRLTGDTETPIYESCEITYYDIDNFKLTLWQKSK